LHLIAADSCAALACFDSKLVRGKGPYGPVVGGDRYNLGFWFSQARLVQELSRETVEVR
jgi:hypothetical protein